jgi:phosphatidylglycerol:prolipoprotein diacylglycerol transferase
MYPFLFQVAGFALGSYGALLVVAIIAALTTTALLGRRDGIPIKKMNDIGMIALISGAVGAKVLDTLVMSIKSGSFAATAYRDAGAVHGGIIFGGVALLIAAKLSGQPFLAVLDAHAPAIFFGQAFGRIGCFLAGCCFGAPLNGPLSVTYSDEVTHRLSGTPLHVSLHAVQLYDAAAHFFLGAVFVFLHKRGLLRGRLLGVYLVVEGFCRFSLEAFRGDSGRGVWLDGLSTGRITAIALAVWGIVGLLVFRPRPASSGA